MILGTYKYTVHSWNKKKTPDLMYISVFYIFFFSLIGHKENRFLLPILPFLFLMTGYSIPLLVKKYGKCVRIVFWIYILVEAFFFMMRSSFHHRFYDVMEYVTNQSEPPHSMYSMHRFETPYYSWLHQRGQAYPEEFPEVNRTKLYVVQ